jgi:hypothetical protein
MHRAANVGFSLLVMAFFALIFFESRTYDERSRAFPMAIAAPMLLLSLYQVGRLSLALYRRVPEVTAASSNENLESSGQIDIDAATTRKRVINILLWMAGSFVLLWLIGFREGLPIFVFLYLWRESKDSLALSTTFGVATWLILHTFFGYFLHYPWPAPQIALLFGFDWPGIN